MKVLPLIVCFVLLLGCGKDQPPEAGVGIGGHDAGEAVDLDTSPSDAAPDTGNAEDTSLRSDEQPELIPVPGPVDFYELTGDVQPPVGLTYIQPDYPQIDLEDGRQGQVILQVIIDTEGKVTVVKIIRGLSEQMNAAASLAVAQWTFKPAMQDGQPVEIYYRVNVKFRLP